MKIFISPYNGSTTFENEKIKSIGTYNNYHSSMVQWTTTLTNYLLKREKLILAITRLTSILYSCGRLIHAGAYLGGLASVSPPLEVKKNSRL